MQVQTEFIPRAHTPRACWLILAVLLDCGSNLVLAVNDWLMWLCPLGLTRYHVTMAPPAHVGGLWRPSDSHLCWPDHTLMEDVAALQVAEEGRGKYVKSQ
jgi:hypothetical protein